jgi:glycerol uptake facilitator protein
MIHELIGEFLGTMVLLTLGCGTVASVLLRLSKGNGGGWIVITTGWFIAVTIGIFVAQSAGSPNADLNPAISLTKYLIGIYTWQQMLGNWVAQIAGAFVGATLAWLCYLPHWRYTPEPQLKLAVFSTIPAIRHYRSNLLCEIIGTLILVIGCAAIFGQATHHGQLAVGMGPYLVGILVWGIGIALGGPTGYAINPARDLGPRLAHAILPIHGKGTSDWSYAWVPIVGPMIAAVIGASLWNLFQ